MDRLDILKKSIFLDFETSSLGERGWPIEIGLSWIVSGKIHTEARLIHPHPTWSMDDWSDVPASWHRIRVEELSTAPVAECIAEWFGAMCAGMILVSDDTEMDRRWAATLMRLIGAPVPDMLDFDTIALSAFDEFTADHVYEKLRQIRKPHRAGPDSRRMALAMLHGLTTDHPDMAGLIRAEPGRHAAALSTF